MSKQLGCLALVLSVEIINAIPNSLPFVRPAHPGDVTVTVLRVLRGDPAAVLTVHNIVQQKSRQDENL